jgi:hypothetical protein
VLGRDDVGTLGSSSAWLDAIVGAAVEAFAALATR